MKSFRAINIALISLLAFTFDLHAQTQALTPADSLPPAFRPDSVKTQTILNMEAGKNPASSPADTNKTITLAQSDSIDAKLHRRHPFLGVMLSFAFSDLSVKDLFATHMSNAVAKATAAQDTEGILQAQDPVTVFFPVGLVADFPVFPYLDVWLRTESFWYTVSGLTEDKTSHTQQFNYGVEGNLAGVGARFLVPVSLLSVNGHPGLYVSYTEFWNVGHSEIYSSDGHAFAKNDPAGAGYEIQSGFQQEFEKRFSWTGALAFTSLSFKSNSPWTNVIPDGPSGNAQWTLRSLRLCLQGFYQFGTKK